MGREFPPSLYRSGAPVSLGRTLELRRGLVPHLVFKLL
jgi:hypothetical protein